MQSRSVRNLNGVHQTEDLDHLVEVDLTRIVLVVHPEGPSGHRLIIEDTLQNDIWWWLRWQQCIGDITVMKVIVVVDNDDWLMTDNDDWFTSAFLLDPQSCSYLLQSWTPVQKRIVIYEELLSWYDPNKWYSYFHRTRVRSLGMLVSNWLTHSLTP